MPAVRIVRNPLALLQATEASAYGVLNLLFAIERQVKSVSVVMGGNRSRNTIKTKAGTPRVGGTLRRSWHAVVYLNGQTIPGSHTVDENGKPAPGYQPDAALQGFVGSNSGYGGYVDQGTVHMTGRPMLQPSVNVVMPEADALIAAGAATHGGVL